MSPQCKIIGVKRCCIKGRKLGAMVDPLVNA